ncbi:MAG: hypothetical protein HUU10_01135 [Bacteroidetes bacterium]|nr:hypothetical protein [Bacteroidota bacterium]
MSESRDGKGNIFLKILIVILGIALIYVIVYPWQQKQSYLKLVKQSQTRMEYLRSGLIYYLIETGNYPNSLNEMVDFMKNNPQILAKKDSIFKVLPGTRLNLDSLLISPVTQKQFVYINSDTSAFKKYLLYCPGGSGRIGSLSVNDSANKATWE